MDLQRLQACCNGLESSKITDRKRNADLLFEILDRKETIEIINQENSTVGWNDVVACVHKFLIKEAEKLKDDEVKKKCITQSSVKKNYGDLLIVTVRQANAKETRLPVTQLIQCILHCFNYSPLKKYYLRTYISILKDYVLAKSNYLGQITENEWTNLLSSVKIFYEQFDSSSDKTKPLLNCLMLLIKNGPLYSLPISQLRKLFPFMQKIGKNINNSSPRWLLEHVLELLLEFYTQTVDDNRMSCCKLGEELFDDFIKLYETQSLDNIKILILKFALLQVKIHHPHGVIEENVSAYAYSWPTWKKQLRYIYCILCDNMNNNNQIKLRSPLIGEKQKQCDILNETFVNLLVEVFMQIYYLKTSTSSSPDDDMQPPSKRQKTENGIRVIITNVEEGRSWQWINFLSVLLKKYVKILTAEDFVSLLKILSAFQAESKCPSIRYYVYECLNILLDVESTLIIEPASTNALWGVVFECTLREIGLNENECQTHALLQKLILKGKATLSSQLFRTFTSQVVNLKEHSVKTLYASCFCFGLPENSSETLLHWILENKCYNTDVFSETITAQTLLFFAFKQWPNIDKIKDKNCSTENDAMNNFEDIYLILSFERLILPAKKMNTDSNIKAEDRINFTYSKEMLERLKNALCEFAQKNLNTSDKDWLNLRNLLNVVILLANVLSLMIDYAIIRDDEIEEYQLTELTKMLLHKLGHIFSTLLDTRFDRKANDASQAFIKVKKLFSLKIQNKIFLLIRKEFNADCLKKIFIILNRLDNEDEETKHLIIKGKQIEKWQLKLMLQDIICAYIDIPDKTYSFEMQQPILETLIRTSFNIDANSDCKMAFAFLDYLETFKDDILEPKTLRLIYTSIQKVCEEYYQNYDVALKILKALKKICCFIFFMSDPDFKEDAVRLLHPFYEFRDNYGPEVSIAMIECMAQLITMDLTVSWPKGDERLLLSVAEFVASNHVKVRFSATQNLTTLFKDVGANDDDITRQVTIFKEQRKKNQEIFCVRDDLNSEHMVDETVTRIATVLHHFAATMITSVLLRQNALYSFLDTINKLKLTHLNLDSGSQILEMIAKHLHVDDARKLLELNLYSLLSQWQYDKNNLSEFPFALFQCKTLMDFYTKYADYVVPMLIENDIKTLKAVCQFNGINVTEALEHSFPEIITKYILISVSETSTHTSTNETALKFGVQQREIDINNKTFENLTHFLTNARINKLVVEKLDQVISFVLYFSYTAEEISKKFSVGCAPPLHLWPIFSTKVAFEAIDYIQKKYLNGTKLIPFCLKNCPAVIEKLLLKTTVNVYKATFTEEKMQAFYHFTIIVDFLLPHLKKTEILAAYAVRTISHTLIHLIHNIRETNLIVNIAACRYFSHFLSAILNQNSSLIETYLVAFVSILTPLASNDIPQLSSECLKLLKLLILDHADNLKEGIKMLDPFPSQLQFQEIQNVYEKIKYEKNTFKLEDEIRQFLMTGKIMEVTGYRTEGLKHLKRQLSAKKTELKELYMFLKDNRGFYEDCQKSILHQLLCTLVNLSLSPDAKESKEAARCLGELGPADLLTTVLNADNTENVKCNPFELVTGCVIALLSKYIVNSVAEVIETSSNALYSVFQCREAKAVTDSSRNYGHGIVNKSYVTPYIPYKIAPKTNYSLKKDFKHLIDNDNLWYPEDTTISHSEWIINLVSTLLQTFSDGCYLQQLIPVCKVKVEFAESLLPLLIYLILFTNHIDIISVQVQRFFKMHWTHTVLNRHNDIGYNKRSVQCMLNVVQYIRIRQSVEDTSTLKDLAINYLYVAQAAQFCSAYFTALLYIELWYHQRIEEISQSENFELRTRGSSPLEIILLYEEPNVQRTLQNILKEAYKRIGESDALLACETIGLLDTELQIEHYEHLQQWEQATLLYDIQMSQGNNKYVPNLLQSLKESGLFHLSFNYKTDTEPYFESAWRLGQWHINQEKNKQSMVSYEKYHYFALKALHDNDGFNFKKSVTTARSCIIDSLRHASLECCKNLYEPLSKFQSLTELEDLEESKSTTDFKMLIQKWNIQDDLNTNEFYYMEPIYSQRIVTLNQLVESGSKSLKEPLVNFYFKLIDFSKAEGKCNIASRTLKNLNINSNLRLEAKNEIMLEEAQLCWLNDKPAARNILRFLLKTDLNPRLHATTLKLYGKWMVETYSENSQTIISDYFMQSLSIMNGLTDKTVKDRNNMYETYDILARFADSQYQQILSYIKSSIFERKVQNMKKAIETAENIVKSNNRTPSRDELKAKAIYERQSKIDQTEIDNTYNEKNLYLRLAIQYYIKNLRHCDVNNIRMFRLLSLWLENRSETEVTNLFEADINKIPSYKFIDILPQVAPHISNSDDQFSNLIAKILERCAIDHPHHTLPIILSLANSNNDKQYCGSTVATISNECRVAGAKNMITKLKTSSDELEDVINKMQFISEALINLAYVDAQKCRSKNTDFSIPYSCKILRVKNYDNVLLPTYDLAVKKNCNYDNIVGICSFCGTFSPVGGINAPKRISCKGTDGKIRRQLVKGQDDLRQDAVMEQVFNIMNGLLRSNKQTMKLMIRTYKIVPLSQRSGILEWVENSIKFGEYLVGENKKPGAHQKYNPGDINPNNCRKLLNEAAKCSNDEKLRVYQKICKKFKPVFHKFFEKSFIQPAVWYEKRQLYMYSVATSSICGYILGIGDRHVHNILIDKVTAEVIHIDFGIAFEQGKVLPTPETVPFRLTRDVEDGMGILGIEGVFRKACEKTLEVLRKNSDTIISILEVLLYDPLYAWTITPAKAYSLQFKHDQEETYHSSFNFSDQDSTPVNITAERALLRLKQKLDGTAEEGSASIEGQVEKLLQQARDPSNLCRLFHGWQAYL